MSDKRAAARRIVAQQKAREKRRAVTLWTSVSVVLVLVIAGLIGWAVRAGQEQDTAGTVATPPSAVDGGTAFPVGDGPVVIDTYEDFLCPVCRQFENSAGPTLQQLVSAGTVTVRYHPIAILDHLSNGTRYSTRAAAASAAAADGGKFSEYHKVLFDSQPPEGSDGLSDAQLIELGRTVGLTDQAFADAITGKKYLSWTTKVTEEASARGVTGTPTVLVAGRQLPNPTPDALKQAVEAAAR
ncbi:MAG TPA: thioredoxin domain-containing protein [Actinoplanes sp.]|nr:thioredoxin domain-containing protein [Actinoplanes sp.]